ncbi:hypothetical protein [Microbacterium sp. Leaf151]|uniref:hypothetical protein n=1 Tax=Microbacterium sp. Leaf151 TaxID=1736276 RepID=UPI0012E3EBC2|nr:hypothetical protein [Microbacterium sp. Leaf151]
MENVHGASAAALAAAALLRAYIGSGHDPAWWDGWLATLGEGPDEPFDTTARLARTDSDTAPRSVLERLHADVATDAVDDGALNLDYLDLLDRVLLDRYMSATETDDLIRSAAEPNRSSTAVRRLHRAYFDGLVSAAWADDQLTAAEWADIQTIGGLLEIDADDRGRRLETGCRDTDSHHRLPPVAGRHRRHHRRDTPRSSVGVLHAHRARPDPEGQHGEEGLGARGRRRRFDVGEGATGACLVDSDHHGGRSGEVAGTGRQVAAPRRRSVQGDDPATHGRYDAALPARCLENPSSGPVLSAP